MENIEKLLEERKGRIHLSLGSSGGNIPVVSASGRSLPEAWENSLIALYAFGADIRTEYDRGTGDRIIDPPSKDCTMTMVVEDPASDPFIHKAFPGGLETLEEYRQEVLEGVKNHWVRDPGNPEDKRWEYTYHERLFSYSLPGEKEGLNQIEKVLEAISRAPHTRRAQAITWQPWKDTGIEDPPCLQSLWFRLMRNSAGEQRLNLNVRFRSRDAYDAAFMNCFVLVLLQEKISEDLSRMTGEKILPGRYLDFSDSYHIYGRRLGDFRDRFLSQIRKRKFEERTWKRAFAEEIFADSRQVIARKISGQDAKYARKGRGGP